MPTLQGLNNIQAPPSMDALQDYSIDDDFFTTWCQSQLSSMDSQIRSYMSGQNVLQNEQTQLSDLKDLLNAAAAEVPKDGYKKGDASAVEAYDGLKQKIQDYEDSHNLPDFVKQKFEDAKNSVDSWTNPPQDVNADNIKELGSSVQPAIDSLQNEASMNMIRMQSLITKRQQAVELTTNMIKKLDDEASSVIANIK